MTEFDNLGYVSMYCVSVSVRPRVCVCVCLYVRVHVYLCFCVEVYECRFVCNKMSMSACLYCCVYMCVFMSPCICRVCISEYACEHMHACLPTFKMLCIC